MCLLVSCLLLCLFTLLPGGLLSRSDTFSQREQGFLEHKKHLSFKGMGRSINRWQLPTDRKITVNFAHVVAYLQPYWQLCPWYMIRSASLDKLRISAPLHWEPTALFVEFTRISSPAFYRTHFLFTWIFSFVLAQWYTENSFFIISFRWKSQWLDSYIIY